MKVEVRFFARCREIVGAKRKELEIEDGMMLNELKELLIQEYPDLKKQKLLLSLNHTYAGSEAKLKEKDEIAVFPPVSGG
jgi:molybdopterin converting factor subunit 1